MVEIKWSAPWNGVWLSSLQLRCLVVPPTFVLWKEIKTQTGVLG